MRSWPARATTTSACSPSGRLLPRARPTCADPATTRGAPVASAEFDCDAAAVRAARRFVIDEARPTGLDAELVALLVSELAANAVLHARTPSPWPSTTTTRSSASPSPMADRRHR